MCGIYLLFSQSSLAFLFGKAPARHLAPLDEFTMDCHPCTHYMYVKGTSRGDYAQYR